MRGTILQRAKGSWTLIVDVGNNSDGTLNQQSVTVKGTKKVPERRLAEIPNKVTNGLYITPNPDTLEAFLETRLSLINPH